jgi:prepilin-type N-terminal cleavage/methylation domain-containing protein
VLKHLQSREDWSEKSLGAKGFTLIELLVVIIILGILAAVAIFAVGSINDRAKANACKTEKGTLETAIEAYNTQADAYPTAVSQLTADQNPPAVTDTIKAQLKRTPKYSEITGTNGGVQKASSISSLPSGCN